MGQARTGGRTGTRTDRRTGATAFLRAGLVDSFGLAYGWTVFLLHATVRQGMGAAALYQCAMFVGVAASAPFSRWLTSRVGGRRLIRTLAGSEAAARAGIFVLVLVHGPVVGTAAVVVGMNVVAWTGYAAMRTEVVAADAAASALTRYALRVAASEAAAAATATLLPVQSTPAIVAAIAVYVAALGPTWWVAGRAVTRPMAAPIPDAEARRYLGRRCLSGGTVMLVAAGPSLMATVLAYHYYGRIGVLVSATSFSVGSLLSPRLAAVVGRRERRRLARWSTFGVLMVAGWTLAAINPVGLGVAQLVSGAAQTAFEGGMDTDLAEHRGAVGPTAAIAYGSASRALGGAAAVAAVPTLLRHAPLGALAAVAAATLLATTAVVRSPRMVRAAPVRPLAETDTGTA